MRVDVGHVERREHPDRAPCGRSSCRGSKRATAQERSPTSTMVGSRVVGTPSASRGKSGVCADEAVRRCASATTRERELEPELGARVLEVRRVERQAHDDAAAALPGSATPMTYAGGASDVGRLAAVLDDAVDRLARAAAPLSSDDARRASSGGCSHADLREHVARSRRRGGRRCSGTRRRTSARGDARAPASCRWMACAVAPSAARTRDASVRSARSSSSSVWNARSASVTRSSTSSTSCRCRSHERTGSAASMTTTESDDQRGELGADGASGPSSESASVPNRQRFWRPRSDRSRALRVDERTRAAQA